MSENTAPSDSFAQDVLALRLYPKLDLPEEKRADFIAFRAALEAALRLHWDRYEEVECVDIPSLMPADLQKKAKAVILDAAVIWEWSLWKLCRYRHPPIHRAADLHAFVDLLRWCFSSLRDAETEHYWADPYRSTKLSHPTVERHPTTEDLLKYAAPLLRADCPESYLNRWLERLDKLSLRKERCRLPALDFFSLPYDIWNKMRRVPGENRPLQPQGRSIDLDRVFDIAVRWCEQQKKRDHKAALKAARVGEGSRPQVVKAGDFLPAKFFLDPERGPQTYSELRRLLAAHPEIRRDNPSPRRLVIHAGDWLRFRHAQGGNDPLDLSVETVEAAVAEMQERREEVRQSQSRK